MALPAGDTNSDGTVDATDYLNVNRAIAASAALDPSDRYAAWADGDFDGDHQITAADLALMTHSYNLLLNRDFDALDHTHTVNATGNSATDLAAFASALSAVASTGGTIIVRGTANLGSTGLTLTNFSNVRIMADPTDGGGFSLSGAPGGQNALLMLHTCSNVLIEGLDFDGGGLSVNEVSVLDSDHVTIDHNTFHDATDTPTFSAAIWALGNLDNHYTNNTFHDLDETAIRAGHTADVSTFTRGSEVEDNPVIVGNTITAVGGDGIIGHMHYALIAGNDLEMADADGNPAGGTAIGISSTAASPGHNANAVISHDVVVFGNTINGAGWHAVQSDVASGDVYTVDCTVMNNTITNCAAAGIYMFRATGWTLTSNTINGTNWSGIQIYYGGSGTIIRDNLITATGATASDQGGIDVFINDTAFGRRDIDHLSIIDNQCVANYGHGISILDQFGGTGSSIVVCSNTCTGNSDVGLNIQNNGGLDISSSDVYDNVGSHSLPWD